MLFFSSKQLSAIVGLIGIVLVLLWLILKELGLSVRLQDLTERGRILLLFNLHLLLLLLLLLLISDGSEQVTLSIVLYGHESLLVVSSDALHSRAHIPRLDSDHLRINNRAS